MAGGRNFFDEFYSETMTEMAGNFFSRRKEMEARLEGFQRLAAEVKAEGFRALRRWRTLFTLLVDEQAAVAFFRELGFDVSAVPAQAAAAGEPWQFRPLFAFTDKGRYVKSVRYAYKSVRFTTSDYDEGSYGTDPKNPKKKVILPNYRSLKDLADRINAEVVSVNTSQAPSTVLAYCRSMDVLESEKENCTGGLVGEDICKIDKELAFAPVDFKGLGLPVLPDLPPLNDVQDSLDRLSESIYSARSEDAMRALRLVSAP